MFEIVIQPALFRVHLFEDFFAELLGIQPVYFAQYVSSGMGFGNTQPVPIPFNGQKIAVAGMYGELVEVAEHLTQSSSALAVYVHMCFHIFFGN